MRHLKTFELIEFNSLYNVGDYIYVDPDWFTDNKPRLGRIIENDGSGVPYRTLFNTGQDFWVKPDMILRKMTADEIEQYELELTADKYNL